MFVHLHRSEPAPEPRPQTLTPPGTYPRSSSSEACHSHEKKPQLGTHFDLFGTKVKQVLLKTLTWSSDHISWGEDRWGCPQQGPSPGSGWRSQSAGNEVTHTILPFRQCRCMICTTAPHTPYKMILTCIWSGCTVNKPWGEKAKTYYALFI